MTVHDSAASRRVYPGGTPNSRHKAGRSLILAFCRIAPGHSGPADLAVLPFFRHRLISVVFFCPLFASALAGISRGKLSSISKDPLELPYGNHVVAKTGESAVNIVTVRSLPSLGWSLDLLGEPEFGKSRQTGFET
jgi:hypothetical protein